MYTSYLSTLETWQQCGHQKVSFSLDNLWQLWRTGTIPAYHCVQEHRISRYSLQVNMEILQIWGEFNLIVLPTNQESSFYTFIRTNGYQPAIHFQHPQNFWRSMLLVSSVEILKSWSFPSANDSLILSTNLCINGKKFQFGLEDVLKMHK